MSVAEYLAILTAIVLGNKEREEQSEAIGRRMTRERERENERKRREAGIETIYMGHHIIR